MSPYSTFWGLKTFVKWLFFRLPLAFSIPFTVLVLAWTLHGFMYVHRAIPWNGTIEPAAPAAFVAMPRAGAESEHLQKTRPGLLRWASYDLVRKAEDYKVYLAYLDELIHALAVIVLFVAGFFLIYNFSALINWIAVERGFKKVRYAAGPPQIPGKVVDREDPLAGVERIGIVLAGGGAKGAFQAGAMKAIYRFLAEHNALDKVKVIAGTSIGSWNALFWLGDLIMPPAQASGKADNDPASKGATGSQPGPPGNGRWRRQSIHEGWWRSISAKTLVAPWWYFPFFFNSFLSSMPWQLVFDHIFGREDVKERIHKTQIHFYMTRSNVRTGELECATNNPHPAKVNRMRFDLLSESDDADEFLRRIRTAVFASMDLPPLFPYMRNDGDLYEDGGVIENLPLSFAAREECDLVFVLPLNADFEEEPNERSIFVRLNRILDVRQGALERQGFKLLYLYNELAALREECEALRNGKRRSGKAPADGPDALARAASDDISRLKSLDRALQRRHKPLRVFAVCPQKSFVQETINTRDLWNSAGAKVAFKEMYSATSALLSEHQFKAEHQPVRVALVSRGGKIIWDESF